MMLIDHLVLWNCRQLVYEELVGRAKEKAAKEEKRRKRAKEDFQLLLRDTRDIEHTSTWEEWQPKLEREPEAKLVSFFRLAKEG